MTQWFGKYNHVINIIIIILLLWLDSTVGSEVIVRPVDEPGVEPPEAADGTASESAPVLPRYYIIRMCWKNFNTCNWNYVLLDQLELKSTQINRCILLWALVILAELLSWKKSEHWLIRRSTTYWKTIFVQPLPIVCHRFYTGVAIAHSNAVGCHSTMAWCTLRPTREGTASTVSCLARLHIQYLGFQAAL